MTAAHKAFAGWSTTPVERRLKILLRAADDIEAQRGPLISLLQREAGKTLGDALAEVRETADLCRYYAAQARAMARDTPLSGPTGEENSLRLHGRGVSSASRRVIFLWRFLSGRSPALVGGNAVAAKPAPQTPLVARKAVDQFLGADCPEDLRSTAIRARRRFCGRGAGFTSLDRRRHLHRLGSAARCVASFRCQPYAISDRTLRCGATRLTERCRSIRHRPRDAAPCRRLPNGNELTWDLKVSPKELECAVDRRDVEELAGNLLDNARKWARDRVKVTVRVHGRGVAIAVEDDGCGIPPELVDDVMTRGVRLDESTPGTGVGLGVVADLVNLHGGHFVIGDSALGGVRAEVRI